MMKKIFIDCFKKDIILFLIALIFIFSSSQSSLIAAEISGPEVKIYENEIYVTTSITFDDKFLEEIKNGIKKELVFHIDLFRVWEMWPDEFIAGKSFTRTIKVDPVKTEFIATSNDGTSQVRKRFKSFESMLQWALNFENIKLANIKDIENGVYFVRVTAESKIRKLPPILGYFMFFVSENSFKIKKESKYFTAGSLK
ncbi:MAG: DUF4390 domain-containing protein [Nitrospirae bacterium]|jgi:hypothetical protein|nr:DUF4390 domain-containing protein [Nitrospirota bacterium]